MSQLWMCTLVIVLAHFTLVRSKSTFELVTTDVREDGTYGKDKALLGNAWITLSPTQPSTTPTMCAMDVAAPSPCTCGTVTCMTGAYCTTTQASSTCTVPLPCNQTAVATVPCTCGSMNCLTGQVCTMASSMCTTPLTCSEGVMVAGQCTCGPARALCIAGQLCTPLSNTPCRTSVMPCTPGSRAGACTCGFPTHDIICREGQICQAIVPGMFTSYCDPAPCTDMERPLAEECLCGIESCVMKQCNTTTGTCSN